MLKTPLNIKPSFWEQSAPTAFAAGYGEESARSSDKIAERFRHGEVIFGAFVDGRLCAIATFLQQTSPKRRHVGMTWNMYVSEDKEQGSPTCFSSTS
jgi:hypothetical protein